MNNQYKKLVQDLTLLLCFVGAYLLLDFVSYRPLYWVVLLLVLGNVYIFLRNPRKGILCFIPFMLLSDWASRVDIRSSDQMASIHTIYLGPFKPLYLYVVILYGLYCCQDVG